MGSLTVRAGVAQRLALAELEQDSPVLDWLAEHDDAVDADGNQVMLVFAPDEPAQRMIADVLCYRHPVLVGTITDSAPSVVRAARPVPGWDGATVAAADLTVATAVEQLQEYPTGVVLVCSLAEGRVLITA